MENKGLYIDIATNEFKMFIERIDNGDFIKTLSSYNLNEIDRNISELAYFSAWYLCENAEDDFKSISEYPKQVLMECVFYGAALEISKLKQEALEYHIELINNARRSKDVDGNS